MKKRIIIAAFVINLLFCICYILSNGCNFGDYILDFMDALLYGDDMRIFGLYFGGEAWWQRVILVILNPFITLFVVFIILMVLGAIGGDSGSTTTYTTYESPVHSDKPRLDEDNWRDDGQFYYYLKEKRHMTPEDFGNLSREDQSSILYKFNGEYRPY